MQAHRVVIVGGGAGGLELACKLGRHVQGIDVTLVDYQLFHIWKPSLHEVAAGTLDIHQEGLSYEMLAHDNRFRFCLGAMHALEPANARVGVASVTDAQGDELLPGRWLPYDQLVLAVGSTANHFNVPGAAEMTFSLNQPSDAERFRLQLLKRLHAADLHQRSGGVDETETTGRTGQVRIVIIGGGATGVELAAELREASVVHASYGLQRLDPMQDVPITLLEGGDRILAPMSVKVSKAATHLLQARQVSVVTACKVTRVTAQQVEDASGRVFASDLVVWAAGIKAPGVLSTLGLPTARSGQLLVTDHLQVQGHHHIYALGDCAACPTADGGWVPPRAQAAHQQASYLLTALVCRARGRPAPEVPYIYLDHGALVSLGTKSSVGQLMGSLFGSAWLVQGLLARVLYVSLHLLHHQAVLGSMRTGTMALARFLMKRARPLVKLH